MAKFLSDTGVTHLVEKLDSRYLKTNGGNSMAAGAGVKFSSDKITDANEFGKFNSGIRMGKFASASNGADLQNMPNGFAYGSLLSFMPSFYGVQLCFSTSSSHKVYYRLNDGYNQQSFGNWSELLTSNDRDTSISTSEIDSCLSSVVFPS